jgi:hypothetical protein
MIHSPNLFPKGIALIAGDNVPGKRPNTFDPVRVEPQPHERILTNVSNSHKFIGPSCFAKQKEHHRKQTFKEELLQFLDDYEIDYDERYLWN